MSGAGRPPRILSFFLSRMLPRGARIEILGDLEERYVRRLARGGAARAWFWYAWQVVDAAVRFTVHYVVRFAYMLITVPAGGRHMFGTFLRDLRFAARNLRRTPGFTLTAVLTLGLGVGANTAIFSVVNGVMLRPLPFPEPERLGHVTTSWRQQEGDLSSMSQPDLRDLQSDASSLAALAGYSSSGFTLTGLGEAEVIDGVRVTDGLLDVFQMIPALGRDIRAAENIPDGPRVVVIGHAFWQERFSGDPEIIGRSIELNRESYEIVGVAPRGFSYPSGAQLWGPLYTNTEGCGRDCHFITSVARLASGVSFDYAGEELRAIGARLQTAYPNTNFEKTFNIRSLGDILFGEVQTGLYIMLGSVGLVLLIACANVANLLIVRGAARSREIAIRSALGAGRSGLVRQLMIEALVLASLGGVVGIGLARLSMSTLVRLAPSDIPRLDEVGIDGTVLIFALASVFAIAVLFGLVPAIRVSGAGVATALRDGARSVGGGQPRNLFRAFLLVAEVAMSLVLLSGAGLLLKSFARMRSVDLGFESDSAITFTLSLPSASYETPDDNVRFFERLEDNLRAHPRIDRVGSVFGRPLAGNVASVSIEFLDRPPVPEGQEPDVTTHVVTPEYLAAIGVPLVRGRPLTSADRSASERVALVSQRMVDQYYEGMEPIGKQIRVGISFGYDVSSEPVRIVGVVGDVRTRSVTDAPVAEVYLPQAQMGSPYLSIVVRGTGDLGTLLPIVREEVRRLDPNLPLRRVESLNDTVARAYGPAKFNLTLLLVFAAVAVTLASIGLYGVVAYLVTQQRREIGVRLALGARADDVIRLVIRQASLPVVGGMAIGVVGTIAAGRVLNSLLYEIPAHDPITLVSVAALLGAVVLAAIFIPARRATTIAPSLALRGD